MSYIQLTWVCWGMFIVAWILGAIYISSNGQETTKRRSRYDWLVLAALIWSVMHYAPNRYLSFSLFHIAWLRMAGSILLIAATVFTLWSRWVLGKMWATNAAVKKEHKLVTRGPYGITRHPIYTGVLGMILGSAMSLDQGVIFLGFIMVLLFFMNRIRNEEQLMEMTFGEQYNRYRKRVPQLVPGLKLFNRK